MAPPPRAVMLSLILGTIACTSRGEPIALPTKPSGLATASPVLSPTPTDPAEDEQARERQRYAAAMAEAEALCDLGHGERCVRLGLAYQKPPVEDLARAAASFSRACDLGEAPGCLALGEALLAGRGVAIDPAQAHARISQACEAGLGHACGHEIFPPRTIEEVIPDLTLDGLRILYDRNHES